MQFLLDADALIKLNLAGLLEIFATAYECATPYAVYREVVIDGRESGHKDAEALDQILNDLIPVIGHEDLTSPPLGDGESAILVLLELYPEAVPVGDDRGFQAALDSLSKEYFSVAAVVALLANQGIISVSQASDSLELLRPVIRGESLELAKYEIGGIEPQ